MGALQPLPSLLALLAVACRMLSCLPAPPCWCWELGLLCCQAGRWAPVASRLAESPAACHTGCCRVGIANLLLSVPDGPRGWQGSPAPCCLPGRLSASPGWPAPRGSWPSSWQPGRVLSTCNHQDFQVLPAQVLCSRKAVSSRNPESKSHLWHHSTLGSAAAPTRVPVGEGHWCPHCQSPPGWEQLRSPGELLEGSRSDGYV